MKKFTPLILLVFIAMMAIVYLTRDDISEALRKEGVTPYKLSEREEKLLNYFGMENGAYILEFKAPKEAITLDINTYYMKDSEEWESSDEFGISIGEERIPTDQLSGVLSIKLEENYAIEFNISCNGRATIKTQEISMESEDRASSAKYLSEFKEIEINKEIPVAMMIYDSGTRMRAYSLEDYFEPSKFEGLDLVQVVTVTFSDK